MKRRMVGLLVLLMVASCVATVGYPQREEPVSLRVDNQFSGMGIVVVRVMCEGAQLQVLRGLPFNQIRTVSVRRARNCASGITIDLTDVTGRRLHWRSQVLPVSPGDNLSLVMGATLNLSHLSLLP